MLSVIIPAYNDERHIKETIKAVYGYLFSHGLDHEIIVVTDGSKDKTLSIAEKLASENKKLSVISHFPNRGYGAALREGLTHAKYEVIVFADGDGQEINFFQAR